MCWTRLESGFGMIWPNFTTKSAVFPSTLSFQFPIAGASAMLEAPLMGACLSRRIHRVDGKVVTARLEIRLFLGGKHVQIRGLIMFDWCEALIVGQQFPESVSDILLRLSLMLDLHLEWPQKPLKIKKSSHNVSTKLTLQYMCQCLISLVILISCWTQTHPSLMSHQPSASRGSKDQQVFRFFRFLAGFWQATTMPNVFNSVQFTYTLYSIWYSSCVY